MMKKLVLLGVVAATLVAMIGASAVAGTAPGNNGTIKVDGRPFDGGMDNDPHVACRMQIDYFGFDASVTSSALHFELWSPTTRSGSNSLLDTTATLSGGTGTKLVNIQGAIAATGVAPHPKQGWHIKITATTAVSNGNDTKTKVIWITPCVS